MGIGTALPVEVVKPSCQPKTCRRKKSRPAGRLLYCKLITSWQVQQQERQERQERQEQLERRQQQERQERQEQQEQLLELEQRRLVQAQVLLLFCCKQPKQQPTGR